MAEIISAAMNMITTGVSTERNAATASQNRAAELAKQNRETPPFQPTADKALEQLPTTGKTLSSAFAETQPLIPQPTNTLGNAMGQIQQVPEPKPLNQEEQRLGATMNPVFAKDSNLYADQRGNSLANPPQEKSALADAQQYAGLANQAAGLVSALRSQTPNGPNLPQPSQSTYQPTADAAMQRLLQLLQMRRGY